MSAKVLSDNIALISELLIDLSDFANDATYLKLFSQKSYMQNLNVSSFVDITYFLVKLIDLKLSKKLPWPALHPEQRNNFMREFHLITEELKTLCRPWCALPSFQKSHFIAPRADSDKVVEFLLRLSTAATFKVTGTHDSDRTEAQLLEDHALLETQLDDHRNRIVELDQKIEDAKLENEKRSKHVIQLQRSFADMGLLLGDDKASISDLVVLQRQMEAKLLEQTVKLQQKLSSEYETLI